MGRGSLGQFHTDQLFAIPGVVKTFGQRRVGAGLPGKHLAAALFLEGTGRGRGPDQFTLFGEQQQITPGAQQGPAAETFNRPADPATIAVDTPTPGTLYL